MKTTLRKALSLLLAVMMVFGTAALAVDVDLSEFVIKAEAAGKTAYKQGDIIEFGSYPQTKVTDKNVIAVLNALDGEWISYGYYTGTGVWTDGKMVPGDYMRYKDVVYGSEKYRGVVFDSYRPYNTSSRKVFYRDSYSNQGTNGYKTKTVYWFKYESIKWRVLDPSTGMVMAENILDSQAFNNYILETGTVREGNRAYWGDPSETYYANNYAKSSIREWLNNDFYNTAFTSEEQKAIDFTSLDNSASRDKYSRFDSETTVDKVYLLSSKDVLNPKYGFISTNQVCPNRATIGTDYAKSQGLWVTESYPYDGKSLWLTRTPHYDSSGVFIVDSGGMTTTLNDTSDGSDPGSEWTNTTEKGIRPALNLSTVITPETYTVTWVVDGKKTAYEYEVGEKITPPANPTKSGHVFKGWNPAVPATMPAKNMTFTAVFKNTIYNLGEETYSFGNFGDSDSEYGHCFGMSVTSSGYYTNELDITDIGAKNGQTLYSMKSTDKVRKPICYYQQIQDEFSMNSTVAGGSAYLTGKYDINSDWNEVVNYVKNHAYDGKGSLQIGFKGVYSVKGELYSGGHAINFLRYEEVNGQPRIYAYDCNFPDVETYFYKDSNGNIKQAPKETFNVSITCIALRSIPKYFELAGGYDPTNYIYAPTDTITIMGATGYVMDGTINGVEYAMYKVPENAEQVIIKPLVDNAEFTYVDESYSFGNVGDDTLGVFTLASGDHGASNVGLEVINVSVDIRTPSTTSITYGDSIVLHADVENLPEGAKIVWSADNSNFTYTASADGTTCTVSPSSSGDTTFTASVVDANGNEITKDEQTMTSNAGFFQKIIAFFKGLFGMNKVIPEAFKSIF